MKNEPTDLEKFQALRITALQTEIETVKRDYAHLELELLKFAEQAKLLSGFAKIGRERVIKTVKDSAFDKPIVQKTYPTNDDVMGH